MSDIWGSHPPLQNLITVLNHGVEEQKALAAGCMFEMSADDDAKDVMVEHGALIPLVKCLSWGVQATSQIAGEYPCIKHHP